MNFNTTNDKVVMVQSNCNFISLDWKYGGI